jgi:hypothetical protein
MLLMLPELPILLAEALRIAGMGMVCADDESSLADESPLPKSFWYNICRRRSLLNLFAVVSMADHLSLLLEEWEVIFIARSVL